MYEVIRYYRQIESVSAVPALPFQLAGSTVDMYFATSQYYGGTLGSLVSCSRASTGNVSNIDGTLTSFGVNTPRIGVGTGLLVEEARTNLVIQSQSFGSTGWGDIAGILSPSGQPLALAPDGSLTANAFVETATNGFHYNGNSFNTITANTPYTHSCYVKAGTRTGVLLTVFSTGFATQVGVFFDLLAGTVGTSFGPVSGSGIQALANGWFRCWFTTTIDATSTTAVLYVEELDAGLSTSFLGVAGDTGIYVWGAQQEAGSFLTSYIPTTVASVTRAADVVSLTGIAGTLLGAVNGSNITVAGPTPNYPNNPRIIGGTVLAALPNVYQVDPTIAVDYNLSTELRTSASSLSYADGPRKTGVAWSAAGRSIVKDNGTVATDGSPHLSDPPYYLGSLGGADSFFDGYIKRVALWNSRLADATLQGLTA